MGADARRSQEGLQVETFFRLASARAAKLMTPPRGRVGSRGSLERVREREEVVSGEGGALMSWGSSEDAGVR
jgi:hypothetical protein